MNSTREQDSSVGGDAGYVCLGVVHMEEEVQDRVQVEVEREEQSERETHGESQNEEAKRNKRSTAHHGWYEDDISARCTDTFQWLVLSHVVSRDRFMKCEAREKNDV